MASLRGVRWGWSRSALTTASVLVAGCGGRTPLESNARFIGGDSSEVTTENTTTTAETATASSSGSTGVTTSYGYGTGVVTTVVGSSTYTYTTTTRYTTTFGSTSFSTGFTTTIGGTTIATSSAVTSERCPVVTGDLIDNMNDGSPFIPQVNGRVGSWTDYADNTPTGMIWPATTSTFTMSSSGDPCFGLSARIYGNGYAVWGAGVRVGLGAPYDAAGHGAIGIQFSAKVGSGSTGNVRVSFPDPDTDPRGGLCDPNSTGAKGCYDHFSQRVLLTPSWSQVTIRFSNLTQDGWGYIPPAFTPSAIYEIQFNVDQGSTFDVWVDNLEFISM